MSRRWMLLRFQTAEKVLEPAEDSVEKPSSHGLFVGSPSAGPGFEPETTGILRHFATLCQQAVASHSSQGVFALALPRGVVHVFRFPSSGIVAPNKLPSGAQVAHFAAAAHEYSVSAVRVVSRPVEESPIIVTVGLDSKLLSVKFWTFSEVDDTIISSGISPGLFIDDVGLPSSPQNHAKDYAASLVGRQSVICSAVLRVPCEAVPSAVAVLDDCDPTAEVQSVAVGFDDASVVFLNGDLLRERFSRVRVAPAAGEMRDARPVTFLAFCGNDLMCVTEQSVAVIRPLYSATASSASEGQSALPKEYQREVLDSRGALEGSSVAHFSNGKEIVVAREEALYFFNKDGRGQCLAFPSESQNTMVSSVGPYLIHATPPNFFVVYDVATRVVSYRGNGDVQAIFMNEANRSFVLVLSDNSILRLDEVGLETRVKMLLSRNMCGQAIGLAKAEAPPSTSGPSPLFTNAVREYAQFLMGKGDYDAAASQLIGTIGGAIDPSWIITRLVEQPGLRSGLRSYLEALHYAGKASFVHTRVLITCYRHDRARAAILKNQKPETDQTADEHIIKVLSDVDWTESQVDTAIDICCEAGLYGVAERVARRRRRHVRLARTLVEHLDDIPGALALLRSLVDQPEAFQVADVCGRKLLARSPQVFTAIAADMITSSGRTEKSSAVVSGGVEGSRMSDPTSDAGGAISHLARLFVDRPRWLASLLETVVNRSTKTSSPVQTEAVWMMLFQSLVRVDVDRAGDVQPGRSALRVLQSRTAKIDMRRALAVSERHGHGPCLEYLYEHMRMYQELGHHLLVARDFSGMLRACRRHGKREPGLWAEAIRLFAPLAGEEQRGDNPSPGDGAGPQSERREPSRVVRHDAGSSPVSSGLPSGVRPSEALLEAMLALDGSGHHSPVEIIEAVCTACPKGKWSLVQKYFDKIVGRLASRAEEDEATAAALSREALEVRAEISRLGDAVVIKPRLCGVCEDQLSPPSVHFFCGHSHHAECLAPSGPTIIGGRPVSVDSTGSVGPGGFGALFSKSSAEEDAILSGATLAEMECPICAPEFDATVSMRKALEEKNNRHDDFFRLLRGTRYGFDIVMDFLERSSFV